MSIGVIGGGAWGTALAQVAAHGGRAVKLWARETDVCESINSVHENALFLPGVPLSSAIVAGSAANYLDDCDTVLIVCPSQFVRSTLATLRLKRGATLVICAKGIEQSSGLLMGEVVAQAVPAHEIAVLSGPTFAHEVAKGLPTGITLACADASLGQSLIATLGQPMFRPYYSADVVGAEIGGAVKNVLAIACGIAAGRSLGENAKATLITRGLAEMLRFGSAKGADPQTLMGLCGLGDLILTCGSAQSRNMSLGMALGRGLSVEDALSGKRTVAEGAATAPVLARVAKSLGVDMPICQSVHEILLGADVSVAITALLARPYRSESSR
jgi:glycerol-3-phosphate dehydrogenase (NAD(P)+)